MKKPNLRQQRFVAEYLIDMNATAAYLRAGYQCDERAAAVNAAKLLRNADIAAKIASKQQKVLSKLELTSERVLQELARVAFFDVRKLCDAEGNPKPLHELDDDTAAAIAGLETVTERGKDEDSERSLVRKYKVSDKIAALGHALKVLGMLRDRVEVKDVTEEEIDDLEMARRFAFLFAKAADQLDQGALH